MNLFLDLKNKITKSLSNSKFQSFFNKSVSTKKIFGKQDTMFSKYYSNLYSNRNECMSKNMDTIIDKLKESFDVHPMLNRVIQNISQKVIETEYVFFSENNDYEKIKLVQDRFKKILRDSDYNDKTFFKEHISNLIKYSNSFSIPFRDKNNNLIQILVVQNKGWHVSKSFGNGFANEFIFEPEEQKSRTFKNRSEVWHYSFNKESDEIFGMPLWVSVIPFLRKHSFILNSAMDSYNDQSLDRTLFMVGVTKNGTIKQVTPESYREIKNVLMDPESDLITDVPINVETLKKNFTSPDTILQTLENQIVAGLYTSKSQLGLSSSGRQDAETQQENTNSIIEDFKNALQNHLNNTLIKEICHDLFGNYDGENFITLRFCEDFNIRERKEKHATYLFQAGIIDLKEARNMCNLSKAIDDKFTFNSLYGNNNISGTVENSNNPQNQHGTQHTTKKSKKDFEKEEKIERF